MKIRTDFVTNSSSVSTAEVVIDNLVLLEILHRYKDMGTFEWVEPYFDIGVHGYFSEGRTNSFTYNPTFFYWEHMFGEGWSRMPKCPKSLADVLDGIIDIMDTGSKDFDQDLYKQMKEELYQRSAEIRKGYRNIKWEHLNKTDISEDDEYKWEYEYDPENGEKYHVELYKKDEDDGWL